MISVKTQDRIAPLEKGVRELDLELDRPLLSHLSSKWVDELGRMFWSAPFDNQRVISLVIPDEAWLQATLRKRDDTWIVNGVGVRKTSLGRGLGRNLVGHLIPPVEAKCLQENTSGNLFWIALGFEVVAEEETSVQKKLLTWRLRV